MAWRLFLNVEFDLICDECHPRLNWSGRFQAAEKEFSTPAHAVLPSMEYRRSEEMNAIARNILETLRIVDTREVGHDSYEICATAQASYDDECKAMQVDLDSFVRRFEMRGKDEIMRPSWLPRRDSVKTHVYLEEAPDAAKEIFDAWAHKVQRAIPPPSEWQRDASWLRDA